MCSAAKKRVLIVDDEHVIADTLAIIFSRAGYESRAAYSAESALELISSWPPDLAVVDFVLPAMNGIDFAILLKATSPDCAIQLLTGRLDTISLRQAVLQRGYAFEVLEKPVHPNKILALASALLPPGSN